MSFELKWSSDACNAALTESSHAIISLGKRKRNGQDSVVDSIDERAALLSIRRLRLGYHSNAHKIISWACDRLKELKVPADAPGSIEEQLSLQLTSSINKALADLIVGCLAAQKDDSCQYDAMTHLFKIVVESGVENTTSVLWLLCHVHQITANWDYTLHKVISLRLQELGNPYTEVIKDVEITPEQSRLCDTVRQYLEYVRSHGSHVHMPIVRLMQEYHQTMMNADTEYVAEVQKDPTLRDISWQELMRKYPFRERNVEPKRYYVSYIMSLIHICPAYANAVWPKLFRTLYYDNMMEQILILEKTHKFSLHKCNSKDEPVTLVDIFPRWLSQVAFTPGGLVMKHALDVAIMLDIVAHNERLNMKELIPTKDNSIMKAMKSSFTVPDLEPASVDLVDWTVELLADRLNGENKDTMQIPIFLLELRGHQSRNHAVELLSHLLFRLDRTSSTGSHESTRYLLFNLINTLNDKWSGVFVDVLDKIFSKLQAGIAKLADEHNPDARVIERVLESCSVIAGPCKDDSEREAAKATMESLQAYLAKEWKTVMSLFVNHPVLTCRVSGLETLLFSRFWEPILERAEEQEMVEKLTQAWFRYLSERFSALHLRGEKDQTLRDAFANLVSDMSQTAKLARQLLETLCDRVFEGALESMSQSKYYTFVMSDNWLLLDIYRKQASLRVASPDEPVGQFIRRQPIGSRFKPRQPRYLAHLSDTEIERSYQDEIYTKNIEDTTYLIDRVTQQQKDVDGVASHIVVRLLSKWPSVVTPMGTYDQSLPQSLPNDRDGLIGNTFRDHAGLFGVLKHCYYDGQPGIHDILKSLLAYYIAFWHMDVIQQAESSLEHCVHLEGTHQLIELLSQTGAIETQLSNCRHLLNGLATSDIGDILYSAIWEYTRQCPVGSEIPGLGNMTRPSSELREKSTKIAIDKVKSIVANRISSRSVPNMASLAQQYDFL